MCRLKWGSVEVGQLAKELRMDKRKVNFFWLGFATLLLALPYPCVGTAPNVTEWVHTTPCFTNKTQPDAKTLLYLIYPD